MGVLIKKLDFWTTQNGLLYLGVQKSAYSAGSPTRFQHILTTTALGMGHFAIFCFGGLSPEGRFFLSFILQKKLWIPLKKSVYETCLQPGRSSYGANRVFMILIRNRQWSPCKTFPLTWQ